MRLVWAAMLMTTMPASTMAQSADPERIFKAAGALPKILPPYAASTLLTP
jgi:hypothetical protein